MLHMHTVNVIGPGVIGYGNGWYVTREAHNNDWWWNDKHVAGGTIDVEFVCGEDAQDSFTTTHPDERILNIKFDQINPVYTPKSKGRIVGEIQVDLGNDQNFLRVDES